MTDEQEKLIAYDQLKEILDSDVTFTIKKLGAHYIGETYYQDKYIQGFHYMKLDVAIDSAYNRVIQYLN